MPFIIKMALGFAFFCEGNSWVFCIIFCTYCMLQLFFYIAFVPSIILLLCHCHILLPVLMKYWTLCSLGNECILSHFIIIFLQKGNTALHYASASGLQKCVELLVAQGAGLFLENRDRLTPCDLAVRLAHHDVATYLESRMVFVSVEEEVKPLSVLYKFFVAL